MQTVPNRYHQKSIFLLLWKSVRNFFRNHVTWISLIITRTWWLVFKFSLVYQKDKVGRVELAEAKEEKPSSKANLSTHTPLKPHRKNYSFFGSKDNLNIIFLKQTTTIKQSKLGAFRVIDWFIGYHRQIHYWLCHHRQIHTNYHMIGLSKLQHQSRVRLQT